MCGDLYLFPGGTAGVTIRALEAMALISGNLFALAVLARRFWMPAGNAPPLVRRALWVSIAASAVAGWVVACELAFYHWGGPHQSLAWLIVSVVPCLLPLATYAVHAPPR